jgi:hypothetical protein
MRGHASSITSYNTSNDRDLFNHQASFFGDYTYDLAYDSGSDKIANFDQSGSQGITDFDFNLRGDRTSEDAANSIVDRRDYTFDGRNRVRIVYGKFRYGILGFKDYLITYSFDHRDRLAVRSWTNQYTGASSQTFYYYDLNDRLIEVKLVPDIASPSTYTIYNFYWLSQRPVAMWSTAYPGATVARYFTHADEANRVLEVYSWPTSGDATLVWALNPDVFGWDRVVQGGPGPCVGPDRGPTSIAQDNSGNSGGDGSSGSRCKICREFVFGYVPGEGCRAEKLLMMPFCDTAPASMLFGPRKCWPSVYGDGCVYPQGQRQFCYATTSDAGGPGLFIF